MEDSFLVFTCGPKLTKTNLVYRMKQQNLKRYKNQRKNRCCEKKGKAARTTKINSNKTETTVEMMEHVPI